MAVTAAAMIAMVNDAAAFTTTKTIVGAADTPTPVATSRVQILALIAAQAFPDGVATSGDEGWEGAGSCCMRHMVATETILCPSISAATITV